MHARPFYATYECLVLTLYMDSSISNIVTLLLDACSIYIVRLKIKYSIYS